MQKQELKDNEKDYNNAVLLLLQNNMLFNKEFITFAPSITSEIESASINKDCSCKNTVFTFIENNKDSFNDFLYDFLIKNDVFISFVEYLNSSPIIKDYSGKIAKTSISEWANFSQKLANDNARFISFSILRDNDDLLVFFL